MKERRRAQIMNEGKSLYDQIPIPENLDQVILDAVQREKREARLKMMQRWTLGVAAAFCIAFLSANAAPVYAFTSQLPVIGTIVRVLHIGTGGERTDGTNTKASVQEETVELHFERKSESMDAVPVYSAEHLLAPNRLILTLQGVRTVDYETVQQSFLETEAVQDVYRMMIGDDSMYGFVIVLNRGYTYEITEYKEPAYLSVHFYTNAEYRPEQTVYYLRSAAIPYGEELGLLNELYFEEGATQLQTQKGDYIITIGQYVTRNEAETALEALKEKHSDGTGLFVSQGQADEIPEE